MGVLTSDIDDRRLTLDLPRSGPGDALALVLLVEVLLDEIPRDVELAIDDPRARVRVHEVLLLRVLLPLVVTTEVNLQRVGGLAAQSGGLVLHDEGVDGLREEDRQVTATLGNQLSVAGYRCRRHVVLLQVRVLFLRGVFAF